MQNSQSSKVQNKGNSQQPMGNEVKAPENPIEQPNNPNQTEIKPQVQNNALTQSQPLKTNDETKPSEQIPIVNGQTPNPTNIYSVQTPQIQNTLKQQKQEVKVQEPQQKQQQSQTPTQTKRFTIQLSEYLITFQLTNSQLIVKGQKQTGRKLLKSQFLYYDFTQQMKALFQSTDQMWSILESAQQCLFFQDFKLYFKIRLGQIQKRIHIPLKDHDSSDQQYIQKLERVVFKYKHLSKELASDIQKHKSQCTCKKSIESPKNEKKDINPKAKGKIKIDRNWLSRASSVWPEAPPNFHQKSDHQLQPSHDFQQNDPLAQFEQLMDKLNTMRGQFNLLAEQIEEKVLSSAGVKILKLKLMGLEKKRKDYFYELDFQKIKFANLKCRNDIYNEIDEFLNEIRSRYSQIERTVNLIRDDK